MQAFMQEYTGDRFLLIVFMNKMVYKYGEL